MGSYRGDGEKWSKSGYSLKIDFGFCWWMWEKESFKSIITWFLAEVTRNMETANDRSRESCRLSSFGGGSSGTLL